MGLISKVGAQRRHDDLTRQIAERTPLEEQLKENEERFRSLVETAEDYAIFVTGRWRPRGQLECRGRAH